jgi:hypothetical protein
MCVLNLEPIKLFLHFFARHVADGLSFSRKNNKLLNLAHTQTITLSSGDSSSNNNIN